jgi:hypothetical protein
VISRGIFLSSESSLVNMSQLVWRCAEFLFCLSFRQVKRGQELESGEFSSSPPRVWQIRSEHMDQTNPVHMPPANTFRHTFSNNVLKMELVHKVLLEQMHTHFLTYRIWLLFCYNSRI